jgi:hypothetical protein
LVHGDFQQGTTLSGLKGEMAVQNWVGDRLRQHERNAYSSEREPHVADEKEPDVRITAKQGDARVAMEIKLAESLSLSECDRALTDQLCGRYLRAANGREGILLLVHQKPRARGWEQPDGTFLTFDQVVDHLSRVAASIRSTDISGPQPYIATLNVSSCYRGNGDG